jgi:mono/diheme cytochrome c family protein
MRSYAKQVAPAWWTLAVAGLVGVLLGSTTLAVRAEQAQTTNDSVYSAAQATRGDALYQEQCAECHAEDLSGGSAPGLAGDEFIGYWDMTPVSDLVEKIVASMPATAPGSLTREQGADITAFMLQAGKFPAGEADLSSDEAALKAILIAKPVGASAPAATTAAPAAGATGAAMTTKDSVYSDAQATRGDALYQEQCAACHAEDLSGGGAPALAGDDFIGYWDMTPVSDLVEKIVSSMPAGDPGSLTREQGADITAFMLRANNFPAGEADLSSDDAALMAISIAK